MNLDAKNGLYCASLFTIVSLLGLIISIFYCPVGMVPDEENHLLRADQISHGRIIGTRVKDESGGVVDAEIEQTIDPLEPVKFHPKRRIDAVSYQDLKRITWEGALKQSCFNNTVIYPPPFYLPVAVVLRLGRMVHASVYHTVMVGRGVNGVIATFLLAAGIALCRRGRWILFGLATLPMSLHLSSSCSQDSLLIATTGFTVGLLSYIIEQKTRTWLLWAMLTLCLAAISCAKLPLSMFCALPFFICSREQRFHAVLLVTCCFVVVLSWYLIGVHPIRVVFNNHVHTSDLQQIRYVLAHPAVMLNVYWETIMIKGVKLRHQFIGVLGWLDAPLPAVYRRLLEGGFVVLLLSYLPALKYERAGSFPWRFLTIAIFVVGDMAFMGLIFYASWDAVGAALINGMQGRYFIPIVFFGSLAFPKDRHLLQATSLPRAFEAILLLTYGGISVFALQETLFLRYWA